MWAIDGGIKKSRVVLQLTPELCSQEAVRCWCRGASKAKRVCDTTRVSIDTSWYHFSKDVYRVVDLLFRIKPLAPLPIHTTPHACGMRLYNVCCANPSVFISPVLYSEYNRNSGADSWKLVILRIWGGCCSCTIVALKVAVGSSCFVAPL